MDGSWTAHGRLWRATLNTWSGLRTVTLSERAFRQELFVLVVAVPVAFALAPSAAIWLMLVGSLVFVMTVELLNTAIEKLCDRVTRDIDPTIGQVKDIGSAAVGIALLLAGAVWLWALVARFWA
jgi:diacylglycerol kinase (ATP)